MLVLARRLNERILIPAIQAAIQVVGIQGNIVRLGIEAPAEIKVFREEVVQDGRPDAPAGDAPPRREDLRQRLADSADELSALRRQLRGKLPAAAAAALFRIDRDLTELARRLRPSAGDDVAPGTTLSVPAAR
jgi:carbon storage regulator